MAREAILLKTEEKPPIIHEEPKEGFFTSPKKQGEAPAFDKTKLVGTKLIDFEFEAKSIRKSFRKKGITSAELKEKYEKFVQETVEKIRRKYGASFPLYESEVVGLCNEISDEVWKNFYRSGTGVSTISEGLSSVVRRSDGIFGLGALDCDTGALLLADILSQFGISSKFVLVM